MISYEFYRILIWCVIAVSPITLCALLFITAPYGRHGRQGWGPTINTRLAWVLMELPSVVFIAIVFFSGAHALEAVPLCLFALWQAHYIQRTLIYPLQIKVSSDKKTAVAVVFMGAFFNLINSTVNGAALSIFGQYTTAWFYDPRFVIGVLLFVTGYVINRQSDAILRTLRKPGETGYKIPQGGFYRWISSPNYFGEMLEWFGWAVATWSLAGLSFALFTLANLLPRALDHHRWYRKKFDDYPAERKAVIPFIL